jgi:Pectate lyase superfamily protein
MSIKALPITGDTNWGTSLNNYLTQLTDNTNGGGINTFTAFSQRPTNLTADDKGKTYLYTQTGNLHQWDGSSWKVLNESVINVKDYGAVGDGVANDSAVVQNLITKFGNTNDNLWQDKTLGSNVLYFPKGHYLVTLNSIGYGFNIKGDGTATILEAVNAGEFVFTTTGVPGGGRFPQTIENVRIFGNNKTKNGIYFNDVNYSLGWTWKKVTADDCDIVLKKEGAIFNNLYDCNFADNNFVIFANASANNHPGFDSYTNVVFMQNKKCCLYYNTNEGGQVGHSTVLQHCWFEANTGFITVLNNQSNYNESNVFKDCWFESNNPVAGNINIEGKDYSTLYPFHLNNSKLRIEKGFDPSPFHLSNSSSVTLVNISIFDSFTTNINSIDLTSRLEYISPKADVNGGCTINNAVDFAEKIDFRVPRNAVTYKAMNSFSNNIRDGKNMIPFGSFKTLPDIYKDPSVATSIILGDGLINNKCLEIKQTSTTPNNFLGAVGDFTIKKDKIYFLSTFAKTTIANSKFIVFLTGAGEPTRIQFNDKPNQWGLYSQIFKSDTDYTNLQFYIYGYNNFEASLRLSKMQLLEFDSLTEATNYAKSNYYSLPDVENISTTNEAIPTVGTWNIGDITYNTNPTAGGYIGWICTVAGTPGTWKPFGKIEL